MKIVAAMSGGVDSAVAAARMVDAGHEVVGVHLDAVLRFEILDGVGTDVVRPVVEVE